jgi:hypothetical protein
MPARRKVTFVAVLVVVAAGVGWLLYDPCYCLVFENTFIHPAHVTSLPSNCAVLTLPERWRAPDGPGIYNIPYQEEAGIFEASTSLDGYEFRRPPNRRDAFYVGLRTYSPGGPSRNRIIFSGNKFGFQFRFPGSERAQIGAVHAISDEDWNSAAPLRIAAPGLAEYPDLPAKGDALIYEGHGFRKMSSFFWSGRRSFGKRRFVVLSYGRPVERSSPDFGYFELFPAWRRMSAAIYEVASGRLICNIRGWACNSGELGAFQHAAWHDDALFAMPLEPGGQSLVLCGFPN